MNGIQPTKTCATYFQRFFSETGGDRGPRVQANLLSPGKIDTYLTASFPGQAG